MQEGRNGARGIIMKYWQVIDDALTDNTPNIKCDTCKVFYPKYKANARHTIKGNANAEEARGLTLHLCDIHFQELQEAGEIEV